MKSTRVLTVAIALLLSACSTNQQPVGPADSGPDGGEDAGPLPAPTITSIAPNTGLTDGGTTVTVQGTNFVAGAVLRLGSTPATGVSVVSDTRITGNTPAAAAGGKVDVVVVNPDQQLARLTQGFTYTVLPAGPSITYCDLQFPREPPDSQTVAGSPITFYGRVYAAGVTDKVGQGAGINMQLGYGADVGSLQWFPASYNVDTDVNQNDEYKVSINAPAAGTYVTLFRAQVNNGAWKYCGKVGIHDAIDPTDFGHMTTTAPVVPPPPQVDYCGLNQINASVVAIPGSTIRYYGEVYKAGLTNANPPAQAPGIELQFGIGQPDGGGFTWSADAAYKGKQPGTPNNDEYYADQVASPVGTYGAAFRARLDAGPWSYCEKNGINATFDGTQVGTLTVPATVADCNLQYPQLDGGGWTGDPITLYGRVYQPDLTDGGTQAPGIVMQAGVAPADGGPFVWTDAQFNTKTDGNNKDEYKATITIGAPGSYLTAYRSFFGDAGVPAYCEVDGLHAGFDPAHAGSLASRPLPTMVDSCAGAAVDLVTGTASPTIFPGQPVNVGAVVSIAGYTGNGVPRPGIVVQASDDVKSNGSSLLWPDAGFFDSSGGSDGYLWTGAGPSDAGVYLTAARVSVNSGPWTFCELSSSGSFFLSNDAGTLTVRPNKVDWCKLDSPVAQVSHYGEALNTVGEVYVAGITDLGSHAGINMQAGIGQPDGGGFSWVDANYQGQTGNNSQYFWSAQVPPSGTYAVAMRASANDGGYTFCELNGQSAAFDPADAGSVVVQAVTVDGCNIQYPQQCDAGYNGGGQCGETAYTAGQPVTYYGQVYSAAQKGTQYIGVVAELGLGPHGTDPSVNASAWRFYQADFNGIRGNNNEFKYPLGFAQNQDDALVYRFTGDGHTWLYCDQAFDPGGFDAGNMDRYAVSTNTDYSSCKLLQQAFTVNGDAGVQVSAIVTSLDGGSDYPVATAQALVGPAGTDPGGPGWTAFNAQYDGGDIHSGGSVWTATVQPFVGTTGVAFRFGKFNPGWYSYAGVDGGCGQGFQIAAEASLTGGP